MLQNKIRQAIINQRNGQPTPQDKLTYVGKKYGDVTLQEMQGTTVDIYDSILLTGQTEIAFFKESNTKTFPFTNLGQNGGTLGQGEGLIGKSMQFWFATIAGGVTTAIAPLSANLNYSMGDFDIEIGNATVLKENKMLKLQAPYSYNAYYAGANAIELETQLAFTNFIPFRVRVTPTAGVSVANTYIFCMISGPGAIFAPQHTR